MKDCVYVYTIQITRLEHAKALDQNMKDLNMLDL